MSLSRNFYVSLADISLTVKKLPLVHLLGWQDVKQRYKRSTIGAFWITISMATTIAMIGLVFGNLFGSNMSQYLPYLATGMIIWGFISSTIIESCLAFVEAAPVLKQVRLPIFLHLLRVVWRNLIQFGHNFLILPVLMLFMSVEISFSTLLIIPGFLLILLNVLWMSLFFAILNARYRDLSQIVQNIFQALFYLTPIMWSPDNLKNSSVVKTMTDLNPFYHLIQLVRAPLLEEPIQINSWIVVGALAIFGWLLVIPFYGRFKDRIVYWL